IWLLAKGKTTEEVQEITGYSRIWIYELVKRYNQLGLKGLGARRKGNPGHPPLIDDVTQAQLWQALQGTAPDGGLWNGRQVADWLTGVTGRKISRQRGWEILRQMTFRLRVPRPAHIESDEDEQQAWKKKLVTELEGLRRRYPDAQVQLWSEDEHRLGLKPVMRRIYVAEDCQPLAHINWKFEWLWLYGFVRPETGETYWWIIPYVNTTLFSRVLYQVRLIGYNISDQCQTCVMPRRISIAPHLSTEELGRADHQAQEGLESRQYQIIWLLAKGKTTEEVQEITG
ncbi:MAG: IS630 family transposase, partial [Limnospira sp. PMC 1234.20]|uniref:IS630 family transposase n=1 Tax=Limnospira sp. PMC 1234.20 TaxID=2981032 RepID=UPI0028E0FE77